MLLGNISGQKGEGLRLIDWIDDDRLLQSERAREIARIDSENKSEKRGIGGL
jgi:hypothetical protein